MDKPTGYKKRYAKNKRVTPRATGKSRRIMPTVTAAEVGRELRNFIRVVDTRIIGATKMWEMTTKKYLVLARLSIGRSPRAEAEALGDLISAIGLHIICPSRWKYKTFSKELIPALQSAREVLGLGLDERFEDVVGSMQ
jgi:hypothetical protein